MSNLEQALSVLKQTKSCNDNMVADAKAKITFGEAFDIAIEAVEKNTNFKGSNRGKVFLTQMSQFDASPWILWLRSKSVLTKI